MRVHFAKNPSKRWPNNNAPLPVGLSVIAIAGLSALSWAVVVLIVLGLRALI
jgi:hypothetical protein